MLLDFTLLGEEERVREASHVPVNRPLEELYEEDKLVADSYRHITDG